MSLVTIIIPCYNYEKYIGDCVRSCLEQDFEDVTVLVIDDHSTDKSVGVVMGINDARLHVSVSVQNNGYSFCKNAGISKNESPYIVHLDADDMLTKSSITERLKVFHNYPKTEITHGYALKIQGDRSYEWCLKHHHDLKRHPSRIHAQGLMVRRSVYEQYGLYYEKLRSKADKEMLFRLGVHDLSPLRKRVNIRRCHAEVAYYRRHDAAMHKMRQTDRKYDKQVNDIFKKRIKQLSREGITKGNTEWLQM